jgi:hypothetical protein
VGPSIIWVMGKHEREEITQLEISVVQMLNGGRVMLEQTNKWYSHILPLVIYIKKRFENYKKAEYVGDEYGKTRGDIKLILDNNEEVFIELKSSETSKSRGTLANIAQNSLTDYGLFGGRGILSWSEFRKKSDFQLRVNILLDQYHYSDILSYDDKARYIRQRTLKGDGQARAIKSEIMEMATEDKQDYIAYLRRFKLNQEKLRKFVYCMVSGIHTNKEILSFINDQGAEIPPLVTLYSNVVKGEVMVSESKGVSWEKMIGFDFVFPKKGEIYSYIVVKNSNLEVDKKILGLILHWKNIFQGIKTPCINVFLAT